MVYIFTLNVFLKQKKKKKKSSAFSQFNKYRNEMTNTMASMYNILKKLFLVHFFKL